MICDAIIRWGTKKAMKHTEIARSATDKLNLIHKVSEGLFDANIFAGEFDYLRGGDSISAKERGDS